VYHQPKQKHVGVDVSNKYSSETMNYLVGRLTLTYK